MIGFLRILAAMAGYDSTAQPAIEGANLEGF